MMPEEKSDGVNIRMYDSKDIADIDIYQDNIISHKTISLSALKDCFLTSISSDTMRFHGILPRNMISYSFSAMEKYVVLLYPAQKTEYIHEEKNYPNFPMPNLVFGIHLNKENMVLRNFLRVLPQGEFDLDTPLYYYPFSNVHENGEICMGRNEALIYDNLQALEHYPEYVLSIPNNNDLFRECYNKRRLGHKKLLEMLAKRKPEYYYKHDLLVPVPNQTLKDFCMLGGKII